MKRKINLRLMADYLGILGGAIIALSVDTFMNGDISIQSYIALVIKLAVPLYLRWGILIYLQVNHLIFVRNYDRQVKYQRRQKRLQRERDMRFQDIVGVANEFYYQNQLRVR